MIINDLLVKGTGRFIDNVYASEFEGDLKGNATSASVLKGAGTLGTQEAMDNFLNTNGVQYTVFSSDTSGLFGGNDGMLLSLPWVGNTNYGAQLAFDDSTNGTVYVRGKANSWGSWYKLLHSGNYTDYAATKDHTHTAISNDLSVSGMIEHKSTKFSSYTIQIQPEEYGGGSWWRIYSNSSGNGNGKGSSIFTLGRSYWSPQNEEYVFSVNVGYNGDINIVQLSGVIGGHLIKKIRVVYKNSSPYYIDFYIDSSEYPNSYYIHGMGYGNYQTPTLVESIEEGYSTYEFSTVAGCKSDKGFYGDLTGNVTGNATSATKATQDASGNTITSTYATKTELNNKSKVQIVRW